MNTPTNRSQTYTEFAAKIRGILEHYTIFRPRDVERTEKITDLNDEITGAVAEGRLTLAEGADLHAWIDRDMWGV